MKLLRPTQPLDLLVVNFERQTQARQQQFLLARELHHRIQNLFGVIQAVVRFSLPGDAVVKESAVKQRLLDRLQSMSVTSRAITDSMDDGVCLTDIINKEIDGFEHRFQISGSVGLLLGAQMAQNLALIFHELVTNALKYGALSAAEGHVTLKLDWASPLLTVTWQERGGPSVKPPATSGFGSRILIEFAKRFCLDTDISYAPSGLRYALRIQSEQIRCADPHDIRPPISGRLGTHASPAPDILAA